MCFWCCCCLFFEKGGGGGYFHSHTHSSILCENHCSHFSVTKFNDFSDNCVWLATLILVNIYTTHSNTDDNNNVIITPTSSNISLLGPKRGSAGGCFCCSVLLSVCNFGEM